MDAVGSSERRMVQSAVNAVNGVGKVNGFDGGDAVRVEGYGSAGAGNTDQESREDVGTSMSSGLRRLAQGHAAAIKVEDSHTGSQGHDSVIDQEQTRTSVDQFTERSDRNGQDVKMEAEHSVGRPGSDGYTRRGTADSARVATSSSTPPRSPAERETTPSAPSIVSTTGSKSPLSGGGGGGGARVHREGSVDSRGTEGTVATSGTSGRGGGGGGGGGGGEVDREKLLATIEMTKKANILQQRLALASFKAQHGWGELSLGEIEPKLAPPPSATEPTATSSTTAEPSSPLRKRKSHIALSIASPTDAATSAPATHPLSPRRSLAFRSPTTSGFGLGQVSPTVGTFGTSPVERRVSGTGTRIGYVPPGGGGGTASAAWTGHAGEASSVPGSPRKRSRLEESSSYDSILGQGRARRGSSEDGDKSPPSTTRYRRASQMGFPSPAQVLDHVAEETRSPGRSTVNGAGFGHRRVASGTRIAYPISPTNTTGGQQQQEQRPYSFATAGSNPAQHPNHARDPASEQLRKKQRSQSHSGFNPGRTHYVAVEQGLPASTDEMDLDAATALTSMLGSGSGRSASPFTQADKQRFAEGEHHGMSPASNLALRNSAAVNSHLKPRSQSFAAVSPPFPATNLASPKAPHARPHPYSSIAQTPSSHARAPRETTSSSHRDRRASASSDAVDDESEDEDKKAAELMIFLAHSPSPMRKVEKKRTSMSGGGTPGGIGRVLFEDQLAGKAAAEGFSPGRFAGLAINSPKAREASPRDTTAGSSAGDRMRLALDSGGDVEMLSAQAESSSQADDLAPAHGVRERLEDMETDFPPIGSTRRFCEAKVEDMRSPHSASTAPPLSATTSMDSADQPVTPASLAMRAPENVSNHKVGLSQA